MSNSRRQALQSVGLDEYLLQEKVRWATGQRLLDPWTPVSGPRDKWKFKLPAIGKQVLVMYEDGRLSVAHRVRFCDGHIGWEPSWSRRKKSNNRKLVGMRVVYWTRIPRRPKFRKPKEVW